MYRSILLLLLGLAPVVLLPSSCGNHYAVAKEFRKMLGNTIHFPDAIVRIPDDGLSTEGLINNGLPKLVIWIDSTECSSCRIGNLYEYEELYRQSRDSGFEVVIMFSPREDEYCDAMHMVGLRHYAFPVYFDSDNSFGIANKIPSDRRFHAFLLHCENRVCFIGDPTSTAKLNSLFGEAMKGIVADR